VTMGREILVFALLAIITTPTFAAGDPATGRIKAISCQVCHGKDGHSTNPIYPNLAGQHARYTAKQMHDFKSGKRVDPVMNEMAQTLSDQDIEDIAAFFQNVK